MHVKSVWRILGCRLSKYLFTFQKGFIRVGLVAALKIEFIPGISHFLMLKLCNNFLMQKLRPTAHTEAASAG